MDFLQKLFGLQDRVAVVTGGASGLGAAFSRGLASAGATVVIADINQSLADEVVGEIERDGGSAEFRRVDVTDVGAVNAFADDLVDAHGRVDVLINSAGAAHRSPIDEFSEEAYDRILALNLKRLHRLSPLECLPVQQGWRRAGDQVLCARVERTRSRERDRTRTVRDAAPEEGSGGERLDHHD
jgi:NAD(P)-dependent dehydrogenase (short-subunit alcohol dehydrogenase family)